MGPRLLFGRITGAIGRIWRRCACWGGCWGGCRVVGRVWAVKRHVSPADEETCSYKKWIGGLWNRNRGWCRRLQASPRHPIPLVHPFLAPNEFRLSHSRTRLVWVYFSSTEQHAPPSAAFVVARVLLLSVESTVSPGAIEHPSAFIWLRHLVHLPPPFTGSDEIHRIR